MDFRATCQFFAGTIFPEEYRGDFDESLKLIETAERRNTESADSEQKANLLLLRFLLHSLRGNFSEADVYLPKLVEIAEELSLRWHLRIQMYTLYRVYLQRYPPSLLFRSEIGGVTSIVVDTELQTLELYNKASNYCQRNRSTLARTDLLESILIQNTFTLPNLIRTYLLPQHPQFPRGAFNIPGTVFNEAPKQHWLERLELLKEWTEEVVFGEFSVRLEHQRLEVIIAESLEDGILLLEAHAVTALARDDSACAAWCKMRHADALLSPAFASPITLNLIAIDSADAGHTNFTWDSCEDALQLIDDEHTQALYDEADKLFKAANCPRGCAAIHLRRACTSHGRAESLPTKSLERLNLLERAQQELAEAVRLFGSDESNVQITKGHQVLIALALGDWSHVEADAGKIGRWGAASQNLMITYFVGALLMRYGRRQWLKRSAIDLALMCYRCAYEVFAAIEDSRPMLQCLVAQMQIHDSVANYVALRSVAERAFLRLKVVSAELRELSARETTTAVVKHIMLVAVRNLILTSAALFQRIYSVSDDEISADRWRVELDALAQENDMKNALKEVLADQKVQEYHLAHTGQVVSQDLFDTADTDRKFINNVHKAQADFERHLLHFDIDEGEALLKQFIAKNRGATPMQQICLVYLLYLMGFTREMSDFQALWTVLPPQQSTSPEKFAPHRRWMASVEQVPKAQLDHFEILMSASVMAQDWQRGWKIVQHIQSANPRSFRIEHGSGMDGWHRFVWAGVIAEHLGRYPQSLQYLLAARTLLEARRSQALDKDARIGIMSTTNAGEVYLGLARLCIRVSQSKIPLWAAKILESVQLSVNTWEEAALLFVEESKARVLEDSLNFSSISNEKSPTPELSGNSIKNNTRDDWRLVQHLSAIPEQYRTLEEVAELTQLRLSLQQQGFSQPQLYPQPVPLSEAPDLFRHDLGVIHRCLDVNELLLNIAFSRHGMVLIAVAASGVVHTSFDPALRDVDIRRPAFKLMRLIRRPELPNLSPSQRKDQISQLTKQISHSIIGPISSIIRPYKHITFSVSQPLSVFPYAILLLDGVPLVRSKSVTSAPSLRTLNRLRRNTSDINLSEATLTTIAKPGDLSKPESLEEAPLPLAGIEAMVVASSFDTWPVNAATLDRTSFRKLMEVSDIIHIGTHGYVHKHSSWLSSLSLSSAFRVLDMTPVENKVALCVFAACLSGLGKTTTGNDIQGFSHAVLASGCKAYIGALWEIDDLSALFLMVLFYRKLADRDGRPHRETVAEIWQAAQIELMDLNHEQCEQLFNDLLQTWTDAETAGRKPGNFVPKGKKLLLGKKKLGKMDMLDLDFSDPFHWAGFSLSGNGQLGVLRK